MADALLLRRPAQHMAIRGHLHIGQHRRRELALQHEPQDRRHRQAHVGEALRVELGADVHGSPRARKATPYLVESESRPASANDRSASILAF